MTTSTDGRRRVLGAGVAILGLIVFVVLGSALDQSTVVSGPDGSSYVTTGNGTAALFALLDETGQSPTRLRVRIEPSVLESVRSLLVIEPGFSAFEPSEVAALERWTSDGGRLVLVGRPPNSLDSLTSRASERWRPTTIEAGATFLPEGLEARSRRFGSFEPDPDSISWIMGANGHVAEVLRLGSGWVVLLADLGHVSNDGIGRGDNARIAASLIGAGPVAFDEVRHGFDDGSGLVAAAPGNWEAALPLLGLALAFALFTYGRRFGPPEPTRRTMIPARAEYIDSLGDALAATGRVAEVADPIRETARRTIRARAHSDGEDELMRAARSLGLDESEFHAVFGDDEANAYTAQHALSKLQMINKEDMP